jgi:hypothetical protein
MDNEVLPTTGFFPADLKFVSGALPVETSCLAALRISVCQRVVMRIVPANSNETKVIRNRLELEIMAPSRTLYKAGQLSWSSRAEAQLVSTNGFLCIRPFAHHGRWPSSHGQHN